MEAAGNCCGYGSLDRLRDFCQGMPKALTLRHCASAVKSFLTLMFTDHKDTAKAWYRMVMPFQEKIFLLISLTAHFYLF